MKGTAYVRSLLTPAYLQLLLLVQLQHHPPEVVVGYLLLSHISQQFAQVHSFYSTAQFLEAYYLILVGVQLVEYLY